jgi:hypothetical protein
MFMDLINRHELGSIALKARDNLVHHRLAQRFDDFFGLGFAARSSTE